MSPSNLQENEMNGLREDYNFHLWVTNLEGKPWCLTLGLNGTDISVDIIWIDLRRNKYVWGVYGICSLNPE